MFDGFFYQLPQLEAEKVYVFGIGDSEQITEDDFETLKPLLSDEELLEVSSIFALPARRVALLAFALRRYVLCYYLGKEPEQLVFVTQDNGRVSLKGNRLFQFDLMKEGVAAFALSMNTPVGLCSEKHAMTGKPKALLRIATLRAMGNTQRGKAERRRIVWDDKPGTKNNTVTETDENDTVYNATTWVGSIHWQSEVLVGHKSAIGVTVLTDKPRELEVSLCLPERIIDALTIDSSVMSQKKYRYLSQA